MFISKYIDLVHRTEVDLTEAFKKVAKAHGDEVDVYQTCMLLSSWSQAIANDLEKFIDKYKKEKSGDKEPERLSDTLLKDTRAGDMALLRDLQDLYLIVSEVEVCCVVLKQGAAGLHDSELEDTCIEVERQSKRQLAWLLTRMKSAAPQTLIVAETVE